MCDRRDVVFFLQQLRHHHGVIALTATGAVGYAEIGRVKRREAEAELGQIEATLKQKLLDIRH